MVNMYMKKYFVSHQGNAKIIPQYNFSTPTRIVKMYKSKCWWKNQSSCALLMGVYIGKSVGKLCSGVY